MNRTKMIHARDRRRAATPWRPAPYFRLTKPALIPAPNQLDAALSSMLDWSQVKDQRPGRHRAVRERPEGWRGW